MDNGDLRNPPIRAGPLEIYIARKTTPLLAIYPSCWPSFFAANGFQGLRDLRRASDPVGISTESPRVRVKLQDPPPPKNPVSSRGGGGTPFYLRDVLLSGGHGVSSPGDPVLSPPPSEASETFTG